VSYITLGSRGPQTGTPDLTSLNPGNWTAAFTPDIINVNQSQFEIYKMIVFCAKPTLVTFDVYVDSQKWDTGVYGNRNSWDPSEPLIMRPGQTLNFLYSNPDTDGFPPVVWIWLRYDPAISVPTV
jgi:hypothetical protein